MTELLFPGIHRSLSVKSVSFFVAVFIFSVLNVVFPLLIHTLVPNGGPIFLPIYFFTLVSGYLFGWQAGLLVGTVSIFLNVVLTGMPPIPALPIILSKSIILGLLSGIISKKLPSLSLPIALFLIVVMYQVFGTVVGMLLLTLDPNVAMKGLIGELITGYPGLILQILGGMIVIRVLDRFYGAEINK